MSARSRPDGRMRAWISGWEARGEGPVICRLLRSHFPIFRLRVPVRRSGCRETMEDPDFSRDPSASPPSGIVPGCPERENTASLSSGLRRILAVRRGALGDFVLTLPALRALRNLGPRGVEIQLLTLPAYGRLAEHFGFAEGWRSIESAPAAALFSTDTALDPEWRGWLAGFDAVVSWLPDRDGLFRRRVMVNGRDAGKPLTFHQAAWLADGDVPAAIRFGDIPSLGIKSQGHVLLPGRDGKVQSGSPDGPNLIALHPGSGSARKNWPFARWVEVMTALSRAGPAITWLLITGESEEEKLPEMTASLKAAGVSWKSAHAMDLIPLTEWLEQCSALVGHDSGISHLASACGVPCFLLFGPTRPDIWAPRSPMVKVLRAAGGDLTELGVGEVLGWLVGGGGEIGRAHV